MMSVAASGSPDDLENQGKTPGSSLPNITLGHVLNYTFWPDQTGYRWVTAGPDGTYLHREGDDIYLMHIEFGNKTVLATAEELVDPNGNPIRPREVLISFDAKYLLLETEYVKGWRHSFFAEYWIFNVAEKKASRLTTSKSDKEIPEEIGGGKVALAVWSPKSHHVAWVRENDLFVKVNAELEVRITNDGSKDVINGITDWVYEEEVYGAHEALWFSPDGSRLAYLKFNETLVPEYRLQLYMHEKENNQYPTDVGIKYPKAGAPNPVVTLHIATPSSPNVTARSVPVNFTSPLYFPDEDRLITEVTWIGENDKLLVRVMNRVQDVQRLFLVEYVQGVNGTQSDWVGRIVRDESTGDGGWFNKLQPLTYIPPSSAVGRQNPSYLELMEDAKGYTHLAYFADVSDKEPKAWLTSGEWEVTGVVGRDADKGVVYYLSTEEGSTQRHLYSVHLDGSTKLQLTPPKNVTYTPVIPTYNSTDIDKKKPVGEVGYYNVGFTPKCEYYHLQYNGPDVPFGVVVRGDGGWGQEVTSNQRLREDVGKYAMPMQKIFTINNTNGDAMNARMLVPANFDPSGNTKYPVLMRVYGGPSSQTVSHQFGIDFMTAVASAGFISISVDGRGTGFKGREYRTGVSKRLGKLEVEDQITAAKWLAGQEWVDEERIGIWGWSYGGYMTSKTIEANSSVFALGMAVAPVTDWRFYDSIYTERYMKTPLQNSDGYEESAVTDMEGFRHAQFLLVHGTGDDNVHFQNTASLIWSLTGARVRNYRVQTYTDSDHSMGANGANMEVYILLWEFLMKGFGVDDRGSRGDVRRRK
ncbi:hypothetical protein HK097_003092 [Rhizophlyctis rosea]|uniref:Dipeptidyl-peptidase IV n=1 Tax=Rhizophlyctis rosea TaxID=64517 RepID=A0AAD5S4E5_9FUNG|nr:hypothetical protein HK097_003092 [Rhizophlyctis rosea]